MKLGDRMKDKVSGFEGIAISKHEYLNGCVRYSLNAEKLEAGKPLIETFDREQLEVTQKEVIVTNPIQTVGQMLDDDVVPPGPVHKPRNHVGKLRVRPQIESDYFAYSKITQSRDDQDLTNQWCVAFKKFLTKEGYFKADTCPLMVFAKDFDPPPTYIFHLLKACDEAHLVGLAKKT